MQSGQVSIWVPIIVGFIGLIGVIAGQLVNAWREDRRWRREQEREDLRWKREAERELAKHSHDSMIDWRERRIKTYGEYLESLHELIDLATEAASYRTTSIDAIKSFVQQYDHKDRTKNAVGQQVRLLASDKILHTMKYNALTMQLPLTVTVVVPTFRPVPPTPEESQKEIEERVSRTRKELQAHVTNAWAYYHSLNDQMRADLGARA
jgi:hypothetical protein